MVLSDAAKETMETELRRIGACSVCVLRFLGVPAADAQAYRDAASNDATEAAKQGDYKTCPCCLGILQFDPTLGAAAAEGAASLSRQGGGGENINVASTSTSKSHPQPSDPRNLSDYVNGMRSHGHEAEFFALDLVLPPALPMRQAATRASLTEILNANEAVSENDKSKTPETNPIDVVVSDDDDEVAGIRVGGGNKGHVALPSTTSAYQVFKTMLIPLIESHAETKHDDSTSFRFGVIFTHNESYSLESDYFMKQASESLNRYPRNRKKRGPPPGLNLPTLVESPLVRWQIAKNAYTVAERVARDKFSTSNAFASAIEKNGGSSSAAVAAMNAVSGGVGGVGGDEKEKNGVVEKTTQRVSCFFSPWHAPTYIGGRYLKWARGVPQSPWFADGEVVGEGSVQQSLEKPILEKFKADGCKLNSAGREDMDVRMLGGGRPFILEVHNPRNPKAFTSSEECLAMEQKMQNSDDGVVTATGIYVVTQRDYIKMHEGSSEKQKTYTAVCWCGRNLTELDLEKLSTTATGLTVMQKTPTRVLHRRTSSTRPRVIHATKATAVQGSSKFFVLELTTQAGTYIKEFVHGDFGRTAPSIGEILGCEADILQLDVTDIEMAFGGGE